MMMGGMASCWVFLLVFEMTSRVISMEYGLGFDDLVGSGSGGGVGKEVWLDSYFPSYSLLLGLTRNSSVGHSSGLEGRGAFSVHVPPQFGIMVVIQALRLRTSAIYSNDDQTTFLKCRDHLRLNAGNQTSQVCGHVTKYSKEGSPSGLLGRRVFITQQSQVSVVLHVDKNLAENDYAAHEPITLEVAFTAFKECPKTTFLSQFIKWTGSSEIRSCSPSEDRICIFSGSYCDGVMNCGVKGPLGHIGYDEENCKRGPGPSDAPPPRGAPLPTVTMRTTTERSYIGVNEPYSPPTSSAVVSPIHLVLIFSTVVLLLFGACTWLAKSNDKKFQHTMYRFNTMRRQRRNNRQRANDETLNRLPSAPPPSSSTSNSFGLSGGGAEEGLSPVEEPPPYADLFPSAPPISSSDN